LTDACPHPAATASAMIMQTIADTTRNRFQLIMFHPPKIVDNDNRYHYIKQPLQIN
jgi:hypothetical protein